MGFEPTHSSLEGCRLTTWPHPRLALSGAASSKRKPYYTAPAPLPGLQLQITLDALLDHADAVPSIVLTVRDETALRRLTLTGRNRFPIWSPDGQWLAFQSDRDGASGIYRQRADGTGNAERLTTAESRSTSDASCGSSADAAIPAREGGVPYARLRRRRVGAWTARAPAHARVAGFAGRSRFAGRR